MKKIFLAMLLLATFVLSGCNTQAAVNQNEKDVKGDLKISMLKVGHGDAILIRTKEQTILIDTANVDERERFIRELKKLSVTKIDKLILTHPHADHIGGARMLIEPIKKQLVDYPYLKKISVSEVYDNGVPYGSTIYKNYMKTVKKTGIHYQTLKVGDTLDFGGGVKFKILFPTTELVEDMKNGKSYEEDRIYRMNNTSIVGKLTYKDFSMMFTGDAEKEAEAMILKNNDAKDLKCDVLKSGHHGCRSSSTKKFVAAINPSVVLISAKNRVENNYPKGSPHLKPLENYLAKGVKYQNIFCTQWNGTITLTSDGKSFSVKPEVVNENWVDEWMTKKREALSKGNS